MPLLLRHSGAGKEIGVLVSHLQGAAEHREEEIRARADRPPGENPRRAVQTYLFGQQTVHDEDQRPLQAVEDGENIRDRYVVLSEQEGPKHPHETQDAHLGDGRHREHSADGTRTGRVAKNNKRNRR